MIFYSKPNYSKHLHEWLKRGRNWHIEYDQYLSNHITHNWIALDAAGVSKSKMQWWQTVYINEGIFKDDVKDTNRDAMSATAESGMLAPPRKNALYYTAITEANWLNNLQSTRIGFESYRDFFDAKIAELGLSVCLKRYYPTLSKGMAGAALHPVIHTGWAVDVESDDMAAEGLAYMATAFQPLATGANHSDYQPCQLWSPDAPDIIEVLKQILTDDRTTKLTEQAYALSKTEDYKNLNRGKFQQRLITFDNPDEPMAQFLNEMVTLRLPDIDDNLAASDLTASIEVLTVIAAAAVYASDNEFFIVHGLTSLHAVLCVLPHLDENAQRNALGYWFRALIAVIILQGSPGVTDALTMLEQWSARRGDKKDSGYQLNDKQQAWWLQTLQSTTDSLDEHVPKTVYVLKRWAEWKVFSSASHDIFAKAARHIATPNESGGLEDNLWFGR